VKRKGGINARGSGEGKEEKGMEGNLMHYSLPTSLL